MMFSTDSEMLQNFLNSLQPSLTVGGVLLALFISCLKLGKFFWNHEREIAKENLDKIRDILGSYKDLFIRPILEAKTKAWVEAAYQEALNRAAQNISSFAANADKEKSSITSADLTDLFSQYNQAQMLADLKANDKVDAFYSSRDGMSLLEKLDAHYLKARDYKRIYDVKISVCRNLMYYFFAVGFIFLLSLGHLLFDFSQALIFFILYSVIILLSLLVINFVRFEVYRRKLISLWEELKTMGNF